MKVFAKGTNGYQAQGWYENNVVTVMKGSIISNKYSEKLPAKILRLRQDKTIISEQRELLVDLKFNSSSMASTFVTGYISNGLHVWKTESGEDIGTVVVGKIDRKRIMAEKAGK